jgi:hypothetical protein
MTLYIADGQTTVNVSFNTPNLTGTHYLTVQSQASNEYWSWVMTPVLSNNRYSEFTINIIDPERTYHINAIYNYEVQYINAQNEQVVVESGLLKYITEEGGSNGAIPYVSPNENRDAVTYYRPQY